MYSSNQHLDISCDYKQFSSVLDFVIRLSGVHECLTREDRRVKPAFRITEDGLYLLKLGSMPADPKRPGSGVVCSKGWIDYPFDYDPEIITRIILQWAETQSVEPAYTDGSTERGIWIRHPNQMSQEAYRELDQKIPLLHVLAVFKPIMLTYDK